MKVRRVFPPLLVLLLATTIATTTQPSSAITPDHGPTASGQGGFTFFNGLRNEAWSFSFDAIANKNGHARGRAIFDILDNFNQTQVVVKIDCLNVQTFSAIITGTVLHSDDPGFPKGANVIFAAEDRTALPDPRPDIMTPLFISPFPDCNDASPPLTMFEVGDSIQIQP